MSADDTRAKSYVVRLNHLARIRQERAAEIIEAADEIRERGDSPWADSLSATTLAAHDVASRIGLPPEDLADPVGLPWQHEGQKIVRRERGARFIVIEGIDGAGTTTQGRDLAEYLQGRSNRPTPTIFTKEPSRGPVGAIIQLALSGRVTGHVLNGNDGNPPTSDDEDAMSTRLNSRTMALLFAADRIDHIRAEIEPNLDNGRTVISDRYLMSTLAYQGLYHDREWLLSINRFALTPDLTIFLDTDVTIARTRFRSTRWSSDIYEGIAEQKQVRENYHDLMNARIGALGPIVRIDSSGARDRVRRAICAIVDQFMETGDLKQDEHVLPLFGSDDAREAAARADS